MTMLSESQSWLADQLTTHMSVSVAYRRGSQTVTFDAVPSKPADLRVGRGSADRVKIDEERLEFHFKPSLLNFGAGQVDPKRGDRITISGVVREVAPNDAQPCWGRSDVFGYMVFVNTIKV